MTLLAAAAEHVRRRAAVTLLTGGSLLFAGCAGGSPSPQPTAAATSPSTSASAPISVSDASKDLHDVRCRHADGGWTFSGKIKNAGKTANFTVIVRVTTKKDEKVSLGLTTLTKTVPTGQTVSFLAKDFSAVTANGNTCVASASKA